MASALDDVVQQMAESGIAGLSAADLKADGQYHRFRPEGERRKKKSGWYILFSFTTRNGKEVYAGVYGRGPDKFTLRPQQNGWSVEEREDFKRRQAERERAFKKERKDRADKAAAKARGLWERFKDRIGAAPYLQRKKVKPYSLRFAPNGAVMVPVRNAAGELRAIQWISADGDKRFSSDAEIDGNFHLLGTPTDEGWLAIGEGYATMASVHMATGLPAVAAFHAGNLEKVAAVLRPLYPKAKFLFVGDDDRHLLPRLDARLATFGITERPPDDGQTHTIATANGAVTVCWRWVNDPAMVLQIEATIDAAGKSQTIVIQNAGRAKASAAARKFKGCVVFPAFADPSEAGTDFNDLHVTQGMDAVRQQIDAALDASAKAGPPAFDANRLQFMLKNWVLLSGTELIWDWQRSRMLPTRAMMRDHGRLVNTWLDHPQRQTINYENVVFEPNKTVDQQTYLNIYNGLELRPDASQRCDRLIEHLQNICGNNPKIFDCVAKWLAYPLKHPGAKMRFALVIHGQREGTGKSIFFSDAMAEIYGKYACIITHAELNMPFNAWLSQKLYCCAEEVVTPQDNKVHQGVLKHYVTGTTLYINDKGIPLRRESNHVNFVFLSNELRPLLIGEHDRRYMVIQYNEEHPKSYFDAIGEEIKQGGIAALLHWLLNYPLDGFDEFTRPIETTAHRELMALGMSAERRFFLCWQAEETPLPFCCCRAIDLYEAFCIWARINGERYVPNSTTFAIAVGRWVPKKSRHKIALFDKKAQAMAKTQAMIYFVGEQPALEPAQELQWLSEGCQEFHDALWKYHGGAD